MKLGLIHRPIGRGVSLASLVGTVPAAINMQPWSGAFATRSDLTDTEFTKTQTTVVAGIVTLDGVSIADKLVESAANAEHRILTDATIQSNSGHTNIPMRNAIIAKAGERSRIVLWWRNFQDPTFDTSVGFDLAGGNVGYDNVVGAPATLVNAAMTHLGNGWWLCTFDAHYTVSGAPATVNWEPRLSIDNGTGTNARSITYPGDGTSGVYIWWWNILPTAAWTLTNLAFREDFDSLDNIDLADTRDPSFTWFTHNLMPDTNYTTFGFATNPPSAPTPAAHLTISSPSVLKIASLVPPPPATAGFTSQIWSVATDGAGGYVGRTFQPSMMWDGYFNWDGDAAAFAAASYYGGNPAFWGMAVEGMVGDALPPDYVMVEFDVVEAAPLTGEPDLGASSSLHDWNTPAAPTNTALSVLWSKTMTLGEFRRMSGLWITMADSGADRGIVMSFYDGQFIAFSDRVYSASSNYAFGETQNFPVMLNTTESTTGPGWAMFIDWVRIYTK